MSKVTYLRGRGITPDRYIAREVQRPNGAVEATVFDTWGGYDMARGMWDRRLAEGRGDRARHDFRYTGETPAPAGPGYFREHVECRTCGEHRLIGPISLTQLNYQESWCLRTLPKLRRKWRRAA